MLSAKFKWIEAQEEAACKCKEGNSKNKNGDFWRSRHFCGSILTLDKKEPVPE
jgi:hypothetical protein